MGSRAKKYAPADLQAESKEEARVQARDLKPAAADIEISKGIEKATAGLKAKTKPKEIPAAKADPDAVAKKPKSDAKPKELTPAATGKAPADIRTDEYIEHCNMGHYPYDPKCWICIQGGMRANDMENHADTKE